MTSERSKRRDFLSLIFILKQLTDPYGRKSDRKKIEVSLTCLSVQSQGYYGLVVREPEGRR